MNPSSPSAIIWLGSRLPIYALVFVRPSGHNTCRASIASGLVCNFPNEDRSAVDMTSYDSLDVSLVLSLNFCIGVPSYFGSPVECVVCWHTTIVTPIIDEVDNEFDTVSFGAGYHIVKALKTISSSVDMWRFFRDEALIPDPGGALGYIVETWMNQPSFQDQSSGSVTPYTNYFQTRSLRCVMTRSTSALLVRNPIQYEFVPAKYPVVPSMLNFKPDTEGIDDSDTRTPFSIGVGVAGHGGSLSATETDHWASLCICIKVGTTLGQYDISSGVEKVSDRSLAVSEQLHKSRNQNWLAFQSWSRASFTY